MDKRILNAVMQRVELVLLVHVKHNQNFPAMYVVQFKQI